MNLARYLSALLVLGTLTACTCAEDIAFPADSGAVDITQAPYSATPNDDTDDTAAFQKALDERIFLIYVPNGTYIIRDTLRWGNPQRRQVLQGQSQAGAILKLKDACEGFDDPVRSKPMVWTGKSPAQRFRNALRNLTLDTGKDNPGATGAQFIANNQGGIFNVTIRSGDPQRVGVIGLNLGYTDEQGPCLIKNVTVEGFDIGIFTSHAVDGVTLEGVTVAHQRHYGFVNDGQSISLRKFRSVNAVPAYLNKAGPSITAMIDSELFGKQGASTRPAIINEAGLFARNIQAKGYKQAIENSAGTKQGVVEANVEEFVSHPVLKLFDGAKRSLNLPIVETPEAPWESPATWVSVTKFGPPKPVTLIRTSTAKKSEREDWSEALQRAIDSGATTIYFPLRREEYGLYGPVRLRGNVQRIIGCETSLGRLVDSNTVKTDYQTELRPVFILEDGKNPTVTIERFDTWYAAPRFEQRSKRTLVIRSMSFYDLETQSGSGDVFLEDVRCKQLVVNQSRLWGRQVNPEGHEEPRILNAGGQIWILGLKTENASTIGIVKDGGKTEIVGGFFYSNKAGEQPIRMFLNDNSSLSVTGGGWKTKTGRIFDVIVQEKRGDETRTLEKAKVPSRGEQSMIPLYVGDATKPAP